MTRNKAAAAASNDTQQALGTQPTDPAPPAAPPPANGNGKSSALAVRPGGDLLAGLDLPEDALSEDGLSEAGGEDRKLVVLMLNFGGKGRDGRNVPRDVYFNTVTETAHDTVNAVFIQLHKTREWAEWIEADQRTEVYCKSFDQLQGRMKDGTIRPCEGCPDYKWRTEKDDKGNDRPVRNCAQVYNVASIDTDTQTSFLIRFKKTSLKPFKEHLRRMHLDRRPLGGGRMGNYPLYVFGVKLTAKMASDKAKHAIPIIEHTRVLSRDEILAYEQLSSELKDQIVDMIKRAETVEKDAGGEGDTSFDTAKYDAAVGQDFTPASDDAG